jgi:hypothetical protein
VNDRLYFGVFLFPLLGAGEKEKKVVEYFSVIFGRNMVLSIIIINSCYPLGQCFSTFVRPWPGKFFFIR